MRLFSRGRADKQKRELDDVGEREMKGALGYVLLGVGVVVLVVVGVWLGLQYSLDNLSARGQFGDQFGLANAIFSGLAFVLLIVTLFLQREELREQRREMRQAREAQVKSSEALEARVRDEQRLAQVTATFEFRDRITDLISSNTMRDAQRLGDALAKATGIRIELVEQLAKGDCVPADNLSRATLLLVTEWDQPYYQALLQVWGVLTEWSVLSEQKLIDDLLLVQVFNAFQHQGLLIVASSISDCAVYDAMAMQPELSSASPEVRLRALFPHMQIRNLMRRLQCFIHSGTDVRFVDGVPL